MRHLLCGIVLAGLFSCSGTDPGTGSRTMYVKAMIEREDANGGTNLVVELRENDRSGLPITDAIVTLKGQSGTDYTVGPIAVRGQQYYQRVGFAWDHGFVLSVRRGEKDKLDAALDMPGATVINEPVHATTYSRSTGAPLVVRWSDDYGRSAQVPEVKLDQADIKQTLANDQYQLEIDASRLVSTSEERVTVTRSNKVLLQGGLDGSEWIATTRHRIEFKVE